MDKVLQDEFVPTLTGNYTVTATALPPFGRSSARPSRSSDRGGGNTTTPAEGRPAVLSVTPAERRTGLPTDIFVTWRSASR